MCSSAWEVVKEKEMRKTELEKIGRWIWEKARGEYEDGKKENFSILFMTQWRTLYVADVEILLWEPLGFLSLTRIYLLLSFYPSLYVFRSPSLYISLYLGMILFYVECSHTYTQYNVNGSYTFWSTIISLAHSNLYNSCITVCSIFSCFPVSLFSSILSPQSQFTQRERHSLTG